MVTSSRNCFTWANHASDPQLVDSRPGTRPCGWDPQCLPDRPMRRPEPTLRRPTRQEKSDFRGKWPRAQSSSARTFFDPHGALSWLRARPSDRPSKRVRDAGSRRSMSLPAPSRWFILFRWPGLSPGDHEGAREVAAVRRARVTRYGGGVPVFRRLCLASGATLRVAEAMAANLSRDDRSVSPSTTAGAPPQDHVVAHLRLRPAIPTQRRRASTPTPRSAPHGRPAPNCQAGCRDRPAFPRGPRDRRTRWPRLRPPSSSTAIPRWGIRIPPLRGQPRGQSHPPRSTAPGWSQTPELPSTTTAHHDRVGHESSIADRQPRCAPHMRGPGSRTPGCDDGALLDHRQRIDGGAIHRCGARCHIGPRG